MLILLSISGQGDMNFQSKLTYIITVSYYHLIVVIEPGAFIYVYMLC